jgi:UPF0755 protein
MTLKRILMTLGACLALAVGGAVTAGAFVWRTLQQPLVIVDATKRVTVKPGSSLSQIVEALAAEGVLEHPGVVAFYGNWTGQATRIKAGEFDVLRGSTPIDLIELLVSGNVVQYSFTIVEGWRFSEMLAALREHEAVELTGISDDDVMALLGSPGVHPEGQFLPDTYHFPRGTTDRAVLARAHAALEAALETAWQTRSNDTAVASPYEALILASIIEKETGLAAERREISGVFSRRLRRGIRLQADPTVIYGLGASWDGDIRNADLTSDNPYNTYTRTGLPPTPIALAGRAAIEAAVDPAPGDSLYFVATGDPDRSHYFSATLEEHNAAVQRYLRRLRERQAPQ